MFNSLNLKEMKQLSKTLVAAMIIVVTIAAIMVGCKKEESAQPNGATQTEQDMSPSEQKVLDFLADYDAMKQGAKAEGEALCPEEARWYYETTVNYCHGFAEERLCNMRTDTIRVAMPKCDEEGYFEYNDVLETYENVVDAIREAYKAIDMNGKTLQLVMMSVEKGGARDGGDDLVIIMNTGSNSYANAPKPSPLELPWYYGPFDKETDWIWGLNRGRCDSTISVSDAADQLTLAIAAYDHYHGSTAIPCPTCYTYFLVEPTMDTSFHGYNTPWLFCETGLTMEQALTWCIPGEDLETYYEEIMLHTHTEDMETNPYGYYGYYKTLVEGLWIGGIPTDQHTIYHDVTVLYATRVWRRDDGTYPIPIAGDE